tara:strand:- start:435 stop:1709 length:1275 start_codon:yes stop_codon:yes gene_type:complete
MVNKGNGFLTLPLVSDSLSSGGTGSSLFSASTQTPMVGHVEGISITNFGLDYASAPDFVLNRNILVQNVSGSFTAGDSLVSHSGTVVNFNGTTNILELSTSVDFNKGDSITSITGATATVFQSTHAEASSTIGTVGQTVGSFVNDQGKVSESEMKVQDSYYYQDYSYVVRIGQSINEWRESVRRSVHPAGWNVFGEVSFSTLISATIQTPTAGRISDYYGDDTYSPELASTFTNLFTTVFGRRLGTIDDSTARVNARVGVANASDLTSGKRDVTLTREITVILRTNRGSHTSGNRLSNLPKYAFAVPPITTSGTIPNYPGLSRTITASSDESRDLYTIDQWGLYRINQVSVKSINTNEFDSNTATMDSANTTFDNIDKYIIPQAAYTTRVNIPPPSQILVTSSGTKFSSDNVEFDDNIRTFDTN